MAKRTPKIVVGEDVNLEVEVKAESVDEVVEVVSPKLKEKLNEIAKEEEVVTIVEQTKKAPTPMVKIKLVKDHRCSIGGEWYSFQAGKQYNVPEQVKNILLRANLLQPL